MDRDNSFNVDYSRAFSRNIQKQKYYSEKKETTGKNLFDVVGHHFSVLSKEDRRKNVVFGYEISNCLDRLDLQQQGIIKTKIMQLLDQLETESSTPVEEINETFEAISSGSEILLVSAEDKLIETDPSFSGKEFVLEESDRQSTPLSVSGSESTSIENESDLDSSEEKVQSDELYTPLGSENELDSAENDLDNKDDESQLSSAPENDSDGLLHNSRGKKHKRMMTDFEQKQPTNKTKIKLSNKGGLSSSVCFNKL